MKQFDLELDAELDSALRRAPTIEIPRNFGQRLIASLPETSDTKPARLWVAPLLGACVALILVLATFLAMETGAAMWLMQTSTLLALLGLETIAALAWFCLIF